ncbi:unnamed protein product, partial [Prorocentrum cordatum]
MLRQGLAVQHEKALAEKWDMQPYTRVTFDILRRHVKSRKFNKYQKFCIMNCACDGVWTRHKAKEKGYLTDGKCECGDEDTLVHRLAECTRPEVVEARHEAGIPESFLQELRQAPDDRVVTQGAFAYPEWEIPELQLGTGSVILDGDGNDFDCTPETMAATVLAETDLEMELSFDGSCTKPDILELQRAGWAIALMDPHSDKVLCTMHAPVPASLPQSSAMAEYLAYAYTGQVADRPTNGYADFMGTVRLAALTHEQQLRSKSAYACVAMFAQSLPGFHFLRSVTHVKAHRSGAEYAGLDVATRRITDANVYADVRAKAGAAMHATISEDFAMAIDTATVRIKHFAQLVAAVLPLFDRDGQERWTRRAAQVKRVRSTRTDGWHQWEEGGFGLQCKACLKLNSPGMEVMLNGCAGTPTFLKAFLNQPLGHHLVAVNQKGDGLSDDAVPTVFACVGCGAWAQQRRRQKLRRQCKPPTRQGIEVLTNLRRGLGPHKTLARHMDLTIPLCKLMPMTLPPLVSKTCVSRPVALAEVTGYEHKMAAMMERIKAKEKAKREQDDDNNTILGRTHISVAKSMECPPWYNSMAITYPQPLKTESVMMTVHAAAKTERRQEQGLTRAAKVERRQEQGLNHMTETSVSPGTASERGQEQGPSRAVAAERRQEQGLNRMMEVRSREDEQ